MFYVDPARPDGLSARCKSCYKQVSNQAEYDDMRVRHARRLAVKAARKRDLIQQAREKAAQIGARTRKAKRGNLAY